MIVAARVRLARCRRMASGYQPRPGGHALESVQYSTVKRIKSAFPVKVPPVFATTVISTSPVPEMYGTGVTVDHQTPLRIFILTVDPSKRVTMDVALAQDQLPGLERTSSMAARHGAITAIIWRLRIGSPSHA